MNVAPIIEGLAFAHASPALGRKATGSELVPSMRLLQ